MCNIQATTTEVERDTMYSIHMYNHEVVATSHTKGTCRPEGMAKLYVQAQTLKSTVFKKQPVPKLINIDKYAITSYERDAYLNPMKQVPLM